MLKKRFVLDYGCSESLSRSMGMHGAKVERFLEKIVMLIYARSLKYSLVYKSHSCVFCKTFEENGFDGASFYQGRLISIIRRSKRTN